MWLLFFSSSPDFWQQRRSVQILQSCFQTCHLKAELMRPMYFCWNNVLGQRNELCLFNCAVTAKSEVQPAVWRYCCHRAVQHGRLHERLIQSLFTQTQMWRVLWYWPWGIAPLSALHLGNKPQRKVKAWPATYVWQQHHVVCDRNICSGWRVAVSI